MNDVIEQLTSFLQSEYIQETENDENVFDMTGSHNQRSAQKNPMEASVNEPPNNIQIYNALNEVYPDTNKIVNKSFDLPLLENEMSPKSITNLKSEKGKQNAYQSQDPGYKLALNTANNEGCRNQGVYRICKDKDFYSYGN